MYGAIIGDIIGSRYEHNNIKVKNFNLYSSDCRFTDDTVMTCALAMASMNYIQDKDKERFKYNCIKWMQLFGRIYPNSGYGGNFINWIFSNNPLPYNSYGNGSAMRVSPVAYVSSSLEEAEDLAEISASVSHNHEEGIKGAKAVASAIFIARHKGTKDQIYKYISEKYYDLNFTIDEIRDNYKFDVSCQGSVPQAIKCFLESKDFEDCIRTAVSIGGDSDTIAAISGSIAGAFYEIPEYMIDKANHYLDKHLHKTIVDFINESEEFNKENKISK